MKSHKDKFIKYLQKQGRATATQIAYDKDISQLIEHLEKSGITDINQITPQHLNDFKNQLKKENYTLKSISRKLNSIKSFFKFLNQNSITSNNPAIEVKHPKYEIQPPRILSPLEYRALRDACRDDIRMYTIVELLLQTGIRIGELANLQLEDIDLEHSSLHIRAHESHSARKVPLNNLAKQAIQNYLRVRPKTRNTTLFITKTGNPFLIRNIRASINRYFRIAGIENAKVNDLRHTFIVEQLKKGASIVELSKIVGHKRLSTTEKYLQYIDSQPETNKRTKLAEL